MFHSFFPKPKIFFTSAALWTIVCIVVWYSVGPQIGAAIGLPPLAPGQTAPIGLAYFFSPDNLWFYLYFTIFVAIFGITWQMLAKDHPWTAWSIWGSAFIIFIAYFAVQVSVALNNWRGPFFDLLQNALAKQGDVTAAQFYDYQLKFLEIGAVGVVMNVVTAFFTNHYVFRWRTAMNNYYMSKWDKLRHIEGASQRIQEDTMRFANILEGLGVTLINSVMTLVVFLPLLFRMSEHVGDLPVIGAIPHALFWLAIVWSIFGTALLALAGIKLPGLNFRNQRVEAAYRKEPGLWRRPCRPGRSRNGAGAVRQCAEKLFPHVLALPLFQRRALFLRPAGRDLPELHPYPDIRCRADNHGHLAADRHGFRRGQQFLPVSGELLVNDHRTAFHPQASCGVRSRDRRQAASGY